DAVKVIDGAIAAFDAEPVAWKSVFRLTGQTGSDFEKIFENREAMDAVVSLHERGGFNVTVTPLYTSPTAQVVPDIKFPAESDAVGYLGVTPLFSKAQILELNACRAAMLQAGNSPVTQDGWIPVSERMPERDVDVQVYCPDKKEQMVVYVERNEPEGWFRFASLPNGGGVYCKPTHWMPLPASPQQEVKSALEHGMQRYAGAMQKLSEGDE
ncbi:MAG: DUF551 domain-containing protein, partial [Hafnia sp.]